MNIGMTEFMRRILNSRINIGSTIRVALVEE